MNKAVFLDRDGVIIKLSSSAIKNKFIYKKRETKIFPGIITTLRALKKRGYLILVVTNQPLVARGIASHEDIEKLHNFINVKLKKNIDKFYFCPHHPEMHNDVPSYAVRYRIVCRCRKPSPGMILQAAKDFNINLGQSWMVGDMVTDIAAGKSAGCKTIMIKSPENKKIIISGVPFDKNARPNHHAKNLSEAIKFIK